MKRKGLFKFLVVTSLFSSFSLAGCNNLNPGEISHVTGIQLNYESYVTEVGKSFALYVSSTSSSEVLTGVSWSSSDESVATVSEGKVKAISAGEATITARYGSYSASCVVTVNEDTGEDISEDYTPDSEDPNILIITEEGEYTLERDYKQIYVNAPEVEVVINLNGHTIENSENSPIYVANCDKLELSATKSTTSYIKDTRSIYTEEVKGQGKGAIYVVDGDLSFKGKGTLNIESSHYNGVHGKDDVKIKNLTLNVSAVNHGIRGNDSVEITSGIINISCGGDGIHTENSDISSSGKQRGNVTVSGGKVTINSWKDAIAASYNAVIEELDSATPTSLSLYTNELSSYEGEVIEKSESSLYLKMNSNAYSGGNYTYAAYINGEWYKATYKETITPEGGMGPGWAFGGPGGGGGQSTYYIYEINKPVSATSFTLYRFSGSNVSTFSTDSYNAKSDAKAFNDSYDMVQISVSGTRISFSGWSTYDDNGISCKGIKAENEINVTGGVINIHSYDDGIHANNDGALENDETPLGNVNIKGGTITIETNDDGLHADNELNISNGVINVTKSYEGLEGNIINISGGESYVYASNDAVNASTGNLTPAINISGGLLDAEVPGGDTDGIDSNGTYTQTGGVVITKGPGSASGSMGGGSFALDADGTIKITSGTLIVFGGIESTPSSSVTRTLCSSSTVSAGSHTVNFSSESYVTTLKASKSGCIVYSSLGSASLS